MASSTKTYSPKAGDIRRHWRVINAADRPLGRVATEIASILLGKDKPTFTPHADAGDFVIVVNAARVTLTRTKRRSKMYYWTSLYPGGLRSATFEQMVARDPRRVIEWAVWGMLPKNRLGRKLLRRLKVYGEETHPHGAQAKELARAVKPGKPGKKPAKKVKIKAVKPAALPKPAPAPAARPAPAPEPVTQAQPAPEAVAPPPPPPPPEPEPAAVEAAVGAAEPVPEPAVPAAEVSKPPAAPEPIKRPTARPRSRRAREQESKAAKKADAAEATVAKDVTTAEQDAEREAPPEEKKE